jgi:hypothetical protein
MSYARKQIILDRNDVSEGLGGKYVDLYDFPDGRLEVRWKGQVLPYRVFSKDQRVSHTAIVENKRLRHALIHHQGTAGHEVPTEGSNQQRKGWIQEAWSSALRA